MGVRILALPLLWLSLFCLWPLVRQRVLPEPEHRTLALTAGFAASIGGLTLWMMVLGLLPGQLLSAGSALAFPVAMWAIGLWPAVARLRRPPSATPKRVDRPAVTSEGWAARWLWLAVGGALAVSLIHSLYYPFVGEDELSRYAYYARLIFEAHRIPDAVSGYPLLVPLGYAYAFFMGGGLDQHLAKTVSWAFAPATVAATYCLASTWAGRRAGLLAAFTLAVTRLFVNWSPMGYVDIPTALYAALAGAFASLWLKRGELRYGVSAGLAAGLAMWAKQSGFAILFSLGLVFLATGVFIRERREVWGQAALALSVAALVALPWYVRNAAANGWQNAVPAVTDYYYSQARRSLLDWLPFLSWAKEFGYGVAPLYLGGMLAGLAMLLKCGQRTAALIQWAFVLPCLGLWWAFFSYEPRFLLTVLPFYAVLVGIGAEWAVSRYGTAIPDSLRAWAGRRTVQSGGAAVLAAALLVSGTVTRAGAIYQLAVAPLASDQEKLLHYKPDVASTVAFLRGAAAPGRDRIYSMDPRLSFYLADYHLAVGYPTKIEQLDGYQYLVTGSWAFNNVYPRLGQADNEFTARLDDPQVFELLFTSELGTVKVYRVLLPSSQAIR